jgi:hypothetical protein
VPAQSPSFVKALIVISPFFHAKAIIQFLIEKDDEQQLFLHVVWLVFATILDWSVLFGFTTLTLLIMWQITTRK